METKKAIEIFKSYRKMRSEKVTSSDRMAIQMLFDESQELVKGKKKPIDWSCGGCVSSAFLVVGNYIDYHLEIVEEPVEDFKEIPVVKKASNVKKKTPKKK